MMMATQTTQPQRRIEAQKGPQRAFLESHADVAIFGGGAGGGKSFALLLEAMRNCHVPSYRAVLFRKTFPQITNPGGMWDESTNIYPFVGAEPRQSELLWKFHSGARVDLGEAVGRGDRPGDDLRVGGGEEVDGLRVEFGFVVELPELRRFRA
jgi:hypothetical protein